MEHECPNCKKVYVHTKEDFERLFNGGHIRVTCNCPKGINILVSGKKKSKPVDSEAFGAAMDIEVTKVRSQQGLKIVEEENPPIRNTTKKKKI